MWCWRNTINFLPLQLTAYDLDSLQVGHLGEHLVQEALGLFTIQLQLLQGHGVPHVVHVERGNEVAQVVLVDDEPLVSALVDRPDILGGDVLQFHAVGLHAPLGLELVISTP
ncbi:MAG: hypothetical protein Q9O62_14530 [Ardenticatenia bacterium]|nr:hypothetical protein [Ardenticatenia bacterium]